MGNLELGKDILHYKEFVDFQGGLIKLIDKTEKGKIDIDSKEYFKLFHNIYNSLNAWNEDFLWITNIYYDYLNIKVSFDKHPMTFSKKHESDREKFQKIAAVLITNGDKKDGESSGNGQIGIKEFFTNIIFAAEAKKKPLEIEIKIDKGQQKTAFQFLFDKKYHKLRVVFPNTLPDINESIDLIKSKNEKISDEAILCITKPLKDYAQQLFETNKNQFKGTISELNHYFGLSNSKTKFEFIGILLQILANILFSPQGLKHLYFLPALCLSSVPGVGGFILATKEEVEKNHIKYLLHMATAAYEKLSSRLLQKYADDIQKKSKVIAIISILVDSFAHNIAAHSLSAMVWFLKQREGEKKELISELETESFSKSEKFSTVVDNISNYLKKDNINALIDKLNNSDNRDLPRVADDMSNHLKKNAKAMEGSLQFTQYLTNKAAFWSGVTRNFECGGESRTWYDVIKDFADNPLFLGTIAHSEGIHRVKIKVGYGKKGSACEPEEFATIDVSSMFKKKENDLDNSNGVRKENEQSQFFQDGKNKKTIEKELSKDKWRLFLPNGIVGQHALYTIFENTIRNIKHAEDLEKAKKDKNGNVVKEPTEIEFNIFIESVDNKHFNTTIWLGNKTRIIEEEKDNDGNDVLVDEEIYKLLRKPVVTENGTPRMGGNSQDKICASMLYNNVFEKVDVKDKDVENKSDLKRPYPLYPWIHVKRDPESKEKLGVIKRSFYVWKGANAVEIMLGAAEPEAVEKTTSAISSEDEEKIVKIKVGELEYENPARFKFVIAPKSEENSESESEKDKQGSRGNLAERGIVRIMDESKCSCDDLNSLYKAWNEKWIKINQTVFLGLGEMGTFVVYHHEGKWNCDRLEPKKFDKIDKSNFCPDGENFSTISFKHGKKGDIWALLYRNHGDFIKKFKHKDGFYIKDKSTIKNEFIETLLTNIEIYDNRICERVKTCGKNRDNINLIELYAKKLFLHVNDENMEKTEFLKKVKKGKANFFIIHLSYIESMNFSEKDISKFIKTCGISLDYKTKLVITTGRGRGEWHDHLDKEHKPHVLFKPIDSLLTAVENGLMLSDDFQVKYNLVKVLLGS